MVESECLPPLPLYASHGLLELYKRHFLPLSVAALRYEINYSPPPWSGVGALVLR